MIKVLLIFLIACFGYSDYFTGKSLQTRPLVLGPLVGLAMGDLQTGCVIGATMELALMGAVGVGAAYATTDSDQISADVNRLFQLFV